MPYESMPNRAALYMEAMELGDDVLWSFVTLSDKLPASVADRAKRSAAFMLNLCELFNTQDPEAAFRDAMRELQHAAVEFGVDWTAEERAAWADVRKERNALGCPGTPG